MKVILESVHLYSFNANWWHLFRSCTYSQCFYSDFSFVEQYNQHFGCPQSENIILVFWNEIYVKSANIVDHPHIRHWPSAVAPVPYSLYVFVQRHHFQMEIIGRLTRTYRSTMDPTRLFSVGFLLLAIVSHSALTENQPLGSDLQGKYAKHTSIHTHTHTNTHTPLIISH